MDWAAEQSMGGVSGSLVSARGRSPETAEDLVSTLFQEHRDSLFRYLVLITHNPAIGEELVQETFLRLHRELRAGVRVNNFRAWLFRVGCNLALDHGRATSSEPIEDRDDFPTKALDPEEAFIERERELRLAGAVRNLPEFQRHCLLLRREGFRYREIAAMLSIGETTVIDHLRRAIQRLQKEMDV